tara:strand:+ start:905 stop:1276 length:372 start_codon:yes stop_codon:yes gene_type:complete
VLTVTKADDSEYYLKQYSLESYQMTFEEKVGGNELDFIKAKDVEQNSTGDYFALTYLNDGVFKLRTFGTVTRSLNEIEKEEVIINELLGLDNYTMPINQFPEPYIQCTFVTNDLLFINLYHNY